MAAKLVPPQNNAPQGLGLSECRCRRREDGSIGRNLVVCIDGTSNRFSQDLNFTNVIRLYNLTEKNATQLTFYNSGIGTYARPSRYSWKSFQQFCYHTFNQAVAWNFEPIVLDAYRWLSDNYEVGDRIFLFGFSRGAYQVRVLSAMIDRVGLIHKGNTKQIEFAYELYEGLKDTSQNAPLSTPVGLSQAVPEPGVKSEVESPDTPPKEAPDYSLAVHPNNDMIQEIPVPNFNPMADASQKEAAERRSQHETVTGDSARKKAPECVFKEAFCREVNVHFVGAWDTVSSVGVMRGESHPDSTSGMKHVCYFRHALALDERRVKFLPEYVHGGATASQEEAGDGSHPHTKEVWFAGSHSDIGGTTSRGDFPPSLMWMAMEAAHMGLRMRRFRFDHKPDKSSERTRSLKGIWWLLEYLPINRLSYKGKGKTTRAPHAGSGRKILKGQKIHESVISDLKTDRYSPKARLSYSPSDTSWTWSHLKDWKRPSDNVTAFPVEPWGELGHVTAYKEAIEHKDQQDILEDLHRSARTESGKRALLQAGVFHALEKLPGSHTGEMHLKDLHTIRDIFDEVYDGRIPERLPYQDVQPLLSHILAHGLRRDFEFAHNFLLDFTDFAPVSIGVFHKHDRDSAVVFASFLPNSGSDRVIAASEDGRIRIWNTKTDGKVFGFRQREKLQSFACSPDGQYAVSTSYTGKIYLWNISERRIHWEGSSPRGSLGPVTFDSHGELIVSAFEDSKLLTWISNPEVLKVEDALHDQSNDSHSHDMAEEQQALLNSSHLHLWGSNRQQLGSELFAGDSGDVVCLAFSQNGRLAAFGRGRKERPPSSGKRSGMKNAIISVYFRDDARSKFQPLTTLVGEKGSRGSIKTLIFSPDGRHLITGGSDNHLRIWDTENWHEKVDFEGHDGDVNAVAISDDNERIVSGSDDGTVRVWNAKALLTGPNLDEHDHRSHGCSSLMYDA